MVAVVILFLSILSALVAVPVMFEDIVVGKAVSAIFPAVEIVASLVSTIPAAATISVLVIAPFAGTFR